MRTARFPFVVLIFLMIFLIGPFLVVLVASFGGDPSLRFPPTSFSLEWFREALEQRSFIRGFDVSIRVAVLSTLASLLVGIPLAYALARYEFPGKAAVELIATLPVIIPQLVVGLALLKYLIITTDLPVIPSLVVGHTTLLIPYAVRITLASLRNVPLDIEQAAVSLGASRSTAFFKVVLPNIRDGVLTAFILAFILSFNNVPVSLFLTDVGVATLPIQMLVYMEYNFDPSIAALSTLLILFSTAVVFAAERVIGLSQAFK
ncbi:MAG: ABC transporter permease [Trueperaceae bacterium]|nr:MAG: ABC transporter permease [Trueperaceae bacterium]